MKLPRFRIATLMFLVIIAALVTGLVVQEYRYAKLVADLKREQIAAQKSADIARVLVEVQADEAQAVRALVEAQAARALLDEAHALSQNPDGSSKLKNKEADSPKP